MRLAQFILANVEPILADWEVFARNLEPGATMSVVALRDDAEGILRATARDMLVDQTLAEQDSKAKGLGGAGGKESDRLDRSSELHGAQRVGSGFDIMEVVFEYRALRASVMRLWRESVPRPDHNDIDDITRFNESMDQSLATAVRSYTDRVDRARRMFLAILGHDLRNPLHTIQMAAVVASEAGDAPDSAKALSVIGTNTTAITKLISDLIDFASTGFGTAMPLTPGPVDLEKLCLEVLEGCRITHPDRVVRLRSNGDLAGNWDGARLRQLVSNLVGNALQYGSENEAIELSVRSEDSSVELSVHNMGEPIPEDMLATIFDPLVRYVSPDSVERRAPGSVGLGLYIVHEIVDAHGGTVTVASGAKEGTRFTVRLPRTSPT